jgi:nicotinamidase/pyrazinamidase
MNEKKTIRTPVTSAAELDAVLDGDKAPEIVPVTSHVPKFKPGFKVQGSMAPVPPYRSGPMPAPTASAGVILDGQFKLLPAIAEKPAERRVKIRCGGYREAEDKTDRMLQPGSRSGDRGLHRKEPGSGVRRELAQGEQERNQGMKRIFCDVDTQHDFLDRLHGALFVPDADKLVPNLAKLITKGALDPDILLIGSLDAHDWSSKEFRENGGPFPRHCVKGTMGQLKVPELTPDRMVIIAKDSLLVSDNGDGSSVLEDYAGAQGFYFEKDEFSLFDNPAAEDVVLDWTAHVAKTRPNDVQVVVFGVATDYCVKVAAIGFRKLGFQVAVVRDAIASVTEEGNQQAFASFWEDGIETIFTEDAVR